MTTLTSPPAPAARGFLMGDYAFDKPTDRHVFGSIQKLTTYCVLRIVPATHGYPASKLEVRMPRFFIDSTDGDLHAVDVEGLELPDLHAARRKAVAVLPEIAKDFVGKLPVEAFATVRDETGKVLYEARLHLAEEWFVSPPA